MIGYDTTLDVTHPTQRTSGQTLPVTVSVERTEGNTGCIDGAQVNVDLVGPETVTTTLEVNEDVFAGTCSASVDLPLDVTPGTYTLTASTGHGSWARTDEPGVHSATVVVDWQHTYVDSGGRGTALLNVVTQQYRIVLSDGRDSGVRDAGSGLNNLGVTGTVSVWRIELSHGEGADRAEGSFLSTGSFNASGVLAGATWYLSR